MATKYDESSITGFTRDLEKIQAKPTLYIGELGAAGINTIVREPCDNGVDEARAGRNTLVSIFVENDGSYWIQDDGVGIPCKMHKTMKINTLTHVLTNLQSSGKMSGDAYKSAIGTHGVGIKATNALSTKFQVWTYRADAGGWHYTEFANGVEKVKVKKCLAPKLPNKKTAKKGTVVRFVPDVKFFGKAKANVKQIADWAEMTSYMNAGLRIQLSSGGKFKEWLSKGGIREYLDKRLVTLKATPMSKKFVFHNTETLELALEFADVEGSEVEFFTNTIRNVELGVHADDMYRALTDSLKPFKGKLEYTPSDLKEGLVGVLNYKINAPQFDSQTKEKLVDGRVKGKCYTECFAVFSEFFDKNKTLAKDIVTRASELRKKTSEFLKDKKLIKNVKNANSGLASKIAGISANSKVPIDRRELYIVEGDSAGGTAKLARDSTFQATYQIKGKPLNVMEAAKDALNKNKELASLMAGLGLDLSKANPLDNLKFGRIIYLADPDVDGKHIQCLLSSVFWKFTPQLFARQQIYIVKSPEYMAEHKGQIIFGSSKEVLYKKAGTQKIDVRHIKGWAEISAGPMRTIAFQIGTRRLLRLLPPKDKTGAKRFEALMGKDAGFRKTLLGVVSSASVAAAKKAGK